ncbi:MAG: radical SAM protein [Paludibacteraceae bacterium]|nr:radical SAM protein [Paludibacteraceae bacterium]
MSTILFDQIAYGPIKSRRLGMSLGVNLLPTNQKLCSFECIYCECGFTKKIMGSKMPTREQVKMALEAKLKEMQAQGLKLDVFTFAGNGEPTMHPEFPGVIDDTIALRNQYFPEAKISVLSNATMIGREDVFNALLKVDNNILKLDSGIDATAKLIDQPNSPTYSVEKQIELLKRFNGNFILQTIFLRGEYNGQVVDNTTPEEIAAWTEAVRQIRPKQVMVYQVDRETPVPGLEKLTNEELSRLAQPVRDLGISVLVA